MPVFILISQALVLGKGLTVSHRLNANLSPLGSYPSEISGSCHWTFYDNETWILRAEVDSLPKELAFEDGSQKNFELELDGEKLAAPWTRSALSTAESYGFRAEMEGRSPTPTVGTEIFLSIEGEPILSGTLSENQTS